MWNELAQAVRPQAQPPGPQAPPPGPPRGAAPPPPPPGPQAGPPPGPPQGGPPMPPPGAPPGQPGQGGTDPAVAQTLMQRAKSITPEEGQAFLNGTTVPALLVLKKILPEMGPAIDKAIAEKGGAGGPPQGAPPPGAPPMPPQGGPPPPPAPGPGAPPPRMSSGLRSV